MRKFFIVFLILFQQSGFSQKHTIPFEKNDWIYVEASINDSSEKFKFVFDTGAGISVIDKSVAKKLNIQSKGSNKINNVSYSIANNQNLNFNGLSLDALLIILDLDHLKERSGRIIDGIIGNDIISKFITHIDFETKNLKLYEKIKNIPELSTYSKNRIRFYTSKPVIPVEFTLKNGDNIEGNFLFDTGASASTLVIASPFAKKHKLVKNIGKTYAVISSGLAERTSKNFIGYTRNIKFNGNTFSDIPIRLSQSKYGTLSSKSLAGILGMEVIDRFQIILDYNNNAIYLKPNSSINRDFKHNYIGISMRKKGEQIFVEDVIKKSPAFIAGILKGDEILSIDEYDKKYLPEIKSIFQQEGKPITLKVKREDGSIKTFEILLERFIN
ncbi:PDZ domain-containing protein [Flavobacteriaceae bacterium AU392]|nr:PDZ domain-containing protein [Flavobacteriaceae bacterium]RKM85017.1 PDZ domain-containing protein [Flavobacteriaceae bacterium AU392]